MIGKIIIFSAGFASGVGAGLALGKYLYERHLQEEIDEVTRFYKERTHEPIAPEPQETPTPTDDTNPEPKRDSDQKRISYNSFSKNTGDESTVIPRNIFQDEAEELEERESVEDEMIEPEEEEYDSPSEGPAERPYAITPERFASENVYYDKTTLTYYEGDNTVTDENDDVINDPEAILGFGFANRIGEFERGVAYIRNEKITTDYEILLDKGSYYDDDPGDW